ncbi:DUF397 domain-containing protein [Nocardia pseudobrasiliensis]|uniref:DUF397 domain-containing protein n=1 Tax=Nocardia pseudobrasiliensis TaxID=45979 RepID=UPI0009EDAC91|nr:DUF397 domain-containing protein [Nocardia pseudobrasiliensis]
MHSAPEPQAHGGIRRALQNPVASTNDARNFRSRRSKGASAVKVDYSGAQWRKSRHSGPDGNCVEVAFLVDGNVGVRDTKDRGIGPVLAFTPGEWDAFVGGVSEGEFRRA